MEPTTRSGKNGIYTRERIRALLHSDLYRRINMSELHENPQTETWRSPLNWTVKITRRIGKPQVDVIILDPSGKLFAQQDDANVMWLDATLP